LAQKNLPILNRTGIYQNWNNLWDSNVNYNLIFKMTTFIEKLITNFLEYRNSFHPFLFNKKLLPQNMVNDQAEQKNPNYFLISRNFRRLKKKRKLYIYVGKITFIKMQSWLIIIVYTFRPKKIKVTSKKKIVAIKKSFNDSYLNYYLGARLFSNNINSNYFL